MNSEDLDLLKEFQIESRSLVGRLDQILDQCESNLSKAKELEEYGQTVDRIMGGAKSLAMQVSATSHIAPVIQQIGDYSALCKAVGYKASQIKDNEQFFDVCVAFLMDATDVLRTQVDQLFEAQPKRVQFEKNFIDRLRWLSNQFGSEFRASVGTEQKSEKLNQTDIDDLMKKLGLD